MKKFLIISIVFMLYSGSSFARGWNDVDTSTNSPHGGFSNSSNICKTCHAVHGAEPTSYRLLHNDSRINECNYCHGNPGGFSSMIRYRDLLDENGNVVQAMSKHTLGSDVILDSDVNG